jgi:serine/threonine protein kinase
MVEAVNYIHKENIFHRDIKPENIFLGFNGKIKIGDFGISEKFKTGKLCTNMDTIGTIHYMSPEIIN